MLHRFQVPSPIKSSFPVHLLLGASLLMSGCQSLLSKNDSNDNSLHDKNITLEQVANDIRQLNDEQITQAESEVSLTAIDDPMLPQNRTVWDRMLAGYQLDKTMNSRIQTEYEWYAKHPEYIRRVQQRAEPFIHHILNEIEKRNLPMELALLPVVESAYQPFAYSHGRAAGLWQFIPSTGKHYGLKQNWWYDGRRDVIAATEAALDYLDSLNNQLGHWEYALAGYNAGAGNVRRAIRRNEKKNKPTDFWSLDLPKETENYVPRLLAISLIFRDAEKLGIDLLEIADEPKIAVVDIPAQIDLAKAAKMAGMDMDQLYNLNPAFNRWATDPAGPHRLLVPVEKEQQFREKLAGLKPEDMLQWQRYKIKNGDSLSVIARNHKTTTSIIKDVNNLHNNRIRAGKYLLIPVSSADASVYSHSVSQRLARKQNTQRKGSRVNYTVQPGDNFWDISRKFNVNYKKLAGWNGMAPSDTLRPGQKLVIWSGKKSTRVASSPIKDQSRMSKIRYTIKRGDSLYEIADKFNVSIADLKSWNNINSSMIKPGQKLVLQVDVTEQL